MPTPLSSKTRNRVQIDLARQQATTTFEDGLTQQYRRIMESIPRERVAQSPWYWDSALPAFSFLLV